LKTNIIIINTFIGVHSPFLFRGPSVSAHCRIFTEINLMNCS